MKKRNYIYMFMAMLVLVFSCQKPELVEDELDTDTSIEAGEVVTGKVPITFSALLPLSPETKAMAAEIQSMHLVIFDGEGMFVEVCEAQGIQDSNHAGHLGEQKYTATLTVTDEPRIIHFIANCPVDQIIYGHEISIIGNLYVENQTAAYWARIEVDNIMVDKIVDGENVHYVPKADILSKFQCVPMLRNYSQVSVIDDTGDEDDFDFLGFTIYNTVDKGTVAPYNSKNQTFQSFLDESGEKYSYPDMMGLAFPFEGHALASADLNSKLMMKDGTYGEYGTYGKGQNVKFYGADNDEDLFMMYERKVSVKTDEEDKWKESPPHVIIMGDWKNNTYFYKVDLVYDVMEDNGTPDDKADDIVKEVKYYNILRNFSYNFTISEVAGPGLETIEDAINGATGNNLSGSATTAKFTNISNNEGRLWVSYTDTTLVNNNSITLKYKYFPNINKPTEDYYGEANNDLVQLENTVGEVISGFESYDNGLTYKDITGGVWDGYREVTFQINEPGNTSFEQVVAVKTNNANLARNIRYYLKKKFEMDVICSPKIEGRIGVPVEIDVHLPLGLTEDMFPLKLDMEVADMTLSPDSKKNIIPVSTGKSVVPLDEFKDKVTFRYTVTIETLDDYKNLNTVGNQKCFRTYWITNAADNASRMYVVNKYFALAYDEWENYKYEFTNLSCSTSEVGLNKDVTISFTMAEGAYNRPVTISLVGMTYNGESSFQYTPTESAVSIAGLKTTTEQDKVSFTLDASEYAIASAEGDRQTYKFNGKFVGVNSLETEADIEVDFTFDIPETAFEALNVLYPDAGADGVPMYVTLDRLMPADDQLEYSHVRAEGDRYLYRIKQAGTQTIKLATTEDTGGSCYVTLQADYFDTEEVEIKQVGREFRRLEITNNRIAQGTGRSVNITFQLATEEGNNAQKDVTVILTNMTINGEHTVTFNTGDNNAVTNNNGTYTIKNVVTADDPAGQLKVTITAKGYSSREATFNKERPKPKFTTSLDKTNLGADANQVVTLTFSSEDLVDGMPVTLELDGLRPQDDLPTKAVSYIYTVKGTGTQTVKLVTTESTTTSKTCSIQLKAEGFESSGIMNVVQSNGISLLNKNYTITLKLNHSQPNNYTVTTTITADDNTIITNGSTTDKSYTGNSQPYQFTINLSNVSISQAKETTKITITSVCRRSSTYTFTKTYTMSELVKLFDGKDTATIDLGQK